MNMQPVIENYLLTCKAESKAQSTIRGYHDVLYDFLDFTGDISLEEFKPEHVQRYMGSLQDKEGRNGPISSHSLHKYYSVLRTFCNWLFAQGQIRQIPTQLLKPPRLSEDLPDALTADEVEKLLGILRSETLRNRTIMKFFLDTGVRLNELATLSPKNLHLTDGWAKVVGKNSKERIVPMGAALCRDVHAYLHRRKAHPGVQTIFTSQHGYELGREGIAQLVRRILVQVRETGKCGPHTLRHTFATLYLRNGGSLEVLRRILGHSQLKVTQRYVHLAVDDVLEEAHRLSPLDALR